MALVESGLAEIGISRAFAGDWIRNHNRTDAELDEREDAKIVDDLKLAPPRTKDGAALIGQLGMLHRLGMSKRDLREYAENRPRCAQVLTFIALSSTESLASGVRAISRRSVRS